MSTKKRYTVSTQTFDSLPQAEKQIQKWNEQGTLKEGTKVFEITENVYEPKIRLVKLPVKK